MYRNPRSCRRCTRPHFGYFFHITHKQYYIWQNMSVVLSLDVCLLCFFVVAAVGLQHAICYCAAGYPWKYICKPVQNAVLDELCHGKQNDRERVGREKWREIDRPWDSMVKFPQIHFGLHFPFENLAVRVACPLQGTAQPSQEIIYH